jgi:hypothetical protein
MSSGGAGLPMPGLLPDVKFADLDLAWREREEEAAELLAGGYDSLALALRLYALEIRIKSIICKQLKLSYLPRACKTHELSELIIFSGMWEELEDPANAALRQNWDLLVRFSRARLNDLRYLPRATIDPTEVRRIYEALDFPTEGVLAWLSRHP